MTLRSLCTRPVVLVRRERVQSTEPYGDDELHDVERVDLLAQVHQRTTSETLVEQDTTSAGWVAMIPEGVSIGRDDVIEVDGVPFQIEGEPYHVWHPPTRSFHHWELSLVETTG
jgi:hypothetical protein